MLYIELRKLKVILVAIAFIRGQECITRFSGMCKDVESAEDYYMQAICSSSTIG
uniref:Uncharacterized protein n=1 Tax=Anguilla anguilla TaxID=7936 RepID=A0A0E9WFT5_ANGAN